MILRIHIKNYKLLRDVTLNFTNTTPMVFIGPNSSGKTTILEVLDLLSKIPNGQLHELIDNYRQGFARIKSINATEGVSFTIVFDAPDIDSLQNSHVIYAFNLSQQGSYFSVSSEKIYITKDDINKNSSSIDVDIMTRIGTNAYFYNHKTKDKDQVTVHSQELAISKVQQENLYPIVNYIKNELSNIIVYQRFTVSPSWNRAARDETARSARYLRVTEKLDPYGIELANYLYHLHNHHHHTIWPKFMASVKAEFPFIGRIFFPVEPSGGKISMAWEDNRFPSSSFIGEQMSDGVISYLCILGSILTPNPKVVIAFDEPDSHLHPSAICRIASLLEDRAKKSPIILTTHSSQFLDYLSDPGTAIHICEPDQNGSHIEKLDKNTLDDWREKFSLSELRRRGLIDPANTSLEDKL